MKDKKYISIGLGKRPNSKKEEVFIEIKASFWKLNEKQKEKILKQLNSSYKYLSK